MPGAGSAGTPPGATTRALSGLSAQGDVEGSRRAGRADRTGSRTRCVGEEMSLPDPGREAEAAAALGFDLSECAEEPIHLLGRIQSHGTLLAVEADTGTVDTAALNTGRLLGIAAQELVGRPITRVLSPEDWAEALGVSAQHEAASLVLPVSIDVAGAPGCST